MKIKIICAALLILPAIAMASVNTKNGNFYITYTDLLKESGGHELHLTRTYNSKATGIGWFGYGWGTSFEARIMVMPDGSVVAQENGGSGREVYYPPKDGSNLQAGVDKIVSVAIERDKLDPDAAEALRKKLLANEDSRRIHVAKYGIQSQLPVGGQVQLSSCTAITRLNDEYQRTKCDEGIDYFDLAGRLIRKEQDDYKVTIHYAGKYPNRIEDSLGQKLFLVWTAAGHVAEARADKDKRVLRYSYDERDNLLLSNEIEGLYYKYEYDSNHNLTRIGYIDGTHMDMQYDEKSLVTSVTDADGSKTTYAYREDPKNPLSHYWTTTTRISTEGEQSSREEEFSLATDAAGVEQLAGFTMTEGQKKQDIVWDERGRVKRVQKPYGGFAEYTYHPTLNKISSVLTDEGETDFEYNKAGDLSRIKNSGGQLITLDYDRNKHIIRMIETDKSKPDESNKSKSRSTRRELTFEYNTLGKPTKIKLIGKGEINVNYDKQGEISKVESKQGAAMAAEVSAAFQILLNVAQVARVDLRM